MKKSVLTLLLSIITMVTYSQNYKFGKVSKEELAEKFYPLDSTAEAVYLYKKKRVYYEYDGDRGWSVITDVHERIKIYNTKGYKYGTKKIQLFERSGIEEKVIGLKAYTFSLEKNGKVKKEKLTKKGRFKEQKTKNWLIEKITMPSLKEGVVIDLRYQINSPYYFFIDKIGIQENIPVKKVNINIRIPEYFVFKNYQKGFHPINVNKRTKNRRLRYSFRSKISQATRTTTTERYEREVNLSENIIVINEGNIPALKTQSYVSNIANYRTSLQLEMSYTQFPNSPREYFSTTWKDVSKKIYESSNFGGELNKTRYFKDELSMLLAEIKDPLKKMSAIFQFVKSKVKWNGDYGKYAKGGVKKAYKEGVGNVAEINLILTSMLRFAGLNANPVLVSTKTNGIPLFPTREGYNYVISSVMFSDKTYVLLDATELFSVPNVLPKRVLNWYGRVIQKEGNSYELKLLPNKHSEKRNVLNVKVTDALGVEGMMRTNYTKNNALNYRKKYNNLKEEEVISKLEEEYNIEIDGFKESNKFALGKPVDVRMKFLSENLIEEINGKLYIKPLLFLGQTKNPFKLKNRLFPVDFVYPWKIRNSVSIHLPTGYKIESLPESLAIKMSNNLGVFRYKIIAKLNKITVVSQLQVNQAVITPEYYEELKEFYNQLVKKQTEKIVLVKN